ncbi:hypothetical protein [Flavobacterium sp. MMS24-S5]|uniref:hypothetical protein n=1 Tax=Flavobacterium sp. MMS24-S5 TaxID=3416605 RepID=UPI003CFCCBC4
MERLRSRETSHSRGIEEISIKDKKEIASICKELISLKEENNLQTRPYDGTIVIEFMRKDQYGVGEYINILSTGIILKHNSEYYITYSRGQYISDHFLARILKYLEIDESKVPALDAYRKSKNSSGSKIVSYEKNN